MAWKERDNRFGEGLAPSFGRPPTGKNGNRQLEASQSPIIVARLRGNANEIHRTFIEKYFGLLPIGEQKNTAFSR